MNRRGQVEVGRSRWPKIEKISETDETDKVFIQKQTDRSFGQKLLQLGVRNFKIQI